MRLIIEEPKHKEYDTNLIDVPLGRAFMSKNGHRYIKLTGHVVVGETGASYSIGDFGLVYVFPVGTTVTIVT